MSNVMGLGLRALNQFASSPLVDRMGLRKPAERLIYQASRGGFVAATSLGRAFRATQKRMQPSRLATGRRPELFDVTPSDEQQMLRDAAQAFAMEQMRAAAQAADTDCAAPAELLQQASELGISLLGIPEDLGGAGTERSSVTQVLIAEALARGDLGLAVACLAPAAVSHALVLWGDEFQQTTYLPAFTGERVPVAALAVMEPRPLFDPAKLETRARRVDDGYVLSGVKTLVPRAAECELLIVAAMLDGQPSLFIVEGRAAGLSFTAEPAMGLRAASTSRVTLNEVHLAPTARLGDASAYAECIALSRLAWCSLAVGTSQAVLDYLLPYVNERVAFGEPISHRQAVAFAVANIGIELEGMRLLTYRAASRADQGDDFVREVALARRLCAEKGMSIGSEGVQLLGGHGFVKEHPVERWYRDLRAAGLMEGVLLV